MDYDTAATGSSSPAITQQQFSERIGGSFIAIIVLFTVGIFLLMLSCTLTRYRRYHRKQSIIEEAFDYQQARVNTLQQQQQQQQRPISTFQRAHHQFPSTTSSCMIDMPPPMYEPPSSKNYLPDDVITRLDHLLHMKYQLKHKPTTISTACSSATNSNHDATAFSTPPYFDQAGITQPYSASALPPPPRYQN